MLSLVHSEHWLEEIAPDRLRPATLAAYQYCVVNYIVPVLGRKRLSRLTTGDVRSLISYARQMKARGRKGQPLDERRPVSLRTVQFVHAVLRAMLAQAVRDELISRNVAVLVQPPRPARDEVRPWDVDSVAIFLEAARSDRLFALYAVAVALGLRRGELLGLRWQDVDLDVRTLRVEQTVQRIAGRGLVVGPPKSRRSRRTIPLPDSCVAALRRHRARRGSERLTAGDSWTDSGLVFATSTGRVIEPRNLNRAFESLCRRSGVPAIRFHDLRHTCASLLLTQGVQARVVMEILGHSQISITLDTYSHVMPAAERDAADRMDAALKVARSKSSKDGR